MIIRLDLRETLIEEGYEVVGDCGRGDEAVALVKEMKPDAVILDIKMPLRQDWTTHKELESLAWMPIYNTHLN